MTAVIQAVSEDFSVGESKKRRIDCLDLLPEPLKRASDDTFAQVSCAGLASFFRKPLLLTSPIESSENYGNRQKFTWERIGNLINSGVFGFELILKEYSFSTVFWNRDSEDMGRCTKGVEWGTSSSRVGSLETYINYMFRALLPLFIPSILSLGLGNMYTGSLTSGLRDSSQAVSIFFSNASANILDPYIRLHILDFQGYHTLFNCSMYSLNFQWFHLSYKAHLVKK